MGIESLTADQAVPRQIFAGKGSEREYSLDSLKTSTSVGNLHNIGVSQGFRKGWLNVNNMRNAGLKTVADILKNGLVVTVETDYGTNSYLLAKQWNGSWKRVRRVSTLTIFDINHLLGHIEKSIPDNPDTMTWQECKDAYGVEMPKKRDPDAED